MRRAPKWLLLATAAYAGLSGVAQAEESVSAEQYEADDSENYAGDDIIVTATRQSTTISRVPISISAFDQSAMDTKGVKSIADAVRFTPGVSYNNRDNTITIRGISSGAGSGTTGIYIDDTPIQMRALGFDAHDTLPAIFDLERVEVLRGPQGTLFGAGSEGGTVRYITPKPGLQDYSAYGRAEISTTEHGALNYEAGAAIGGPIVYDKLGFRISAYHRRDGGWIDKSDADGVIYDKDANHGDVTVLHGALSFKPTSELTVTPAIHFQKRSKNTFDEYVEGLSDPNDGVFLNSSPEYRGSRDKFYMPSLNVEYDNGDFAVVSNTSYYHRNNTTGYDGTMYNLSYYSLLYGIVFGEDAPYYPFVTETGVNPDLPYYYSPAVVTNTQRNFTQELRLQSSDPDARLSWVVGLFYQRSKQKSIEELVETTDDLFPTTFGITLEQFFEYELYGDDSYINQTKATDTQIAGFANLTYALTDKLKVTLGGRYAKTKYSFDNFADGSQNGLRTTASGKSTDKPFTPKAGLSYQADDNNLFYATWSKGFRAGAANAPVPPICGNLDTPDSYGSDKVESWEVGSKNKLFDRRLQIAASAYVIDWKDIQQSVYIQSCGIQYTDNLGSARSKGFDLQLSLKPVSGLSLEAALGYNSSEYTATVLSAEGAQLVEDGDKLGTSPWTGSVGAQYDFSLGASNAFARIDYQFTARSSGPTSAQNPDNDGTYDPIFVQTPATNFVSLRAGTDLMDGANLSVFVDNLFDSSPRLNRLHYLPGTDYITNRTFRPRTIGLTLTYRR
ncbi:TonB-dependent receptor [Altericroceibacterium spongiae]|uniref:TonB-dependent receptor n=1 Tax=Altericroceibacterium spongiae TaxID=2320269 RepID=A0A420EQM6_9SPHN|nr:TonB-dependent receptor [Altericroceibacterium spongiae]RKF22950.1 TonB-dependent receptor [Altericroceibacterium spongiae]